MTIANSLNAGTTSKYVVDITGNAPYSSIQSAMDAANAAGGSEAKIVYVRAGNYTEDLTLYSNVFLQGDVGTNRTQITGIHTLTTGTFNFENIYFRDTGDIFSAGAVTFTLGFLNCGYEIDTSGYLVNGASATGFLNGTNLLSFSGANDGFINNGTGGFVTTLRNSSVGASGLTGTANGNVFLYNSDINCDLDVDAVLTADHCRFTDTLLANVNSSVIIRNSSFSTGSVSAFDHQSSNPVYFENVSVDSSNTNAITGTGGTLITGSLSFQTSEIINVVTPAPMPTVIGGMKTPMGGSDSYAGIGTLAAGTVTINTSSVQTFSNIYLTSTSAPAGTLYISAIVNGVSFTVTSTNAGDTSTFDWLIVNPA